jgi:hypothetical protein
MKEAVIERALIKRVKELGGEVRKVQWIGRSSAPDRLVMLPETWKTVQLAAYGHHPSREDQWLDRPAHTIWVEVKNPDTIKTFPADARERAQHREHERMRRLGQCVEVIGTLEQIESLLS